LLDFELAVTARSFDDNFLHVFISLLEVTVSQKVDFTRLIALTKYFFAS
jgi:hypothetical protein